MTVSPLRFDLARLEERLGERRFRRAESYAERGYVRLIAIESRTVCALVSGESGSTYAVELDEDGAGACTCPDFGETTACKHLGAVALIADGLDLASARTLNGRIARLKDSLAFEDAEGLRRLIVALAKRTPGVLEALEGEGEDGAD